MITKAEILASVEAQIRKDIPRLMELREGCKVLSYKRMKTIVSNKNNSLITIDYLDGGIGFLDEKSFQIIGHEITLSDVLEFLFKSTLISYYISSSGEIFYWLIEGEPETRINIYWDLSSPYLKDQSEELIKFLYNIKRIKNAL